MTFPDNTALGPSKCRPVDSMVLTWPSSAQGKTGHSDSEQWWEMVRESDFPRSLPPPRPLSASGVGVRWSWRSRWDIGEVHTVTLVGAGSPSGGGHALQIGRGDACTPVNMLNATSLATFKWPKRRILKGQVYFTAITERQRRGKTSTQ